MALFHLATLFVNSPFCWTHQHRDSPPAHALACKRASTHWIASPPHGPHRSPTPDRPPDRRSLSDSAGGSRGHVA